MEYKLLDDSIERATGALQGMSAGEVQELPLLDCAIILGALHNTPQLVNICELIASRLREQLQQSWVEKGAMSEVFSVLGALWKYNSTNISGGLLASAVQRLVGSEAAVGGPYYSKGKIAITANMQVAIFMRLAAKPLPGIDAFLSRVTTAKRFESTELTRYSLLYLLAKAHNTPELTAHVANHRHQSDWQSPGRRAMALSVLRGKVPVSEVKPTLETLCGLQQKSGFWDGESLLRASKPRSGSHFTTTALIYEVLSDYQQAQSKDFSVLQRRQRTIARSAKQMFSLHTEPLRSLALAMINQVCKADKNFEITLLPQFFAKALESPGTLADQRHTTLGLANLCVWIAYTIYDDFLDNEGSPIKLPVANIAMRASLDCFRTALPDQVGFQQYVAKTFTAMDEANAWEVSRCRFTIHAGKAAITKLPSYGSCGALAARSFAHALAPMAILAQHPPCTKEHAHRVESAFRHYLIARQLNDDLHDWLKDMRAGQASYAVTAILRDMHVRPGTYNLSTLLPAMQRRFRQTTMPKMCSRILWHIKMCRKAFAKSELLRAENDIYSLIDGLEMSVRHSLEEHTKIQAFYAGTSKFEWEH